MKIRNIRLLKFIPKPPSPPTFPASYKFGKMWIDIYFMEGKGGLCSNPFACDINIPGLKTKRFDLQPNGDLGKEAVSYIAEHSEKIWG